MNYRHAYHAGNFADVHKHVVLTRILAYLMRKDAPFRVIDTHAGVGLYDLSGTEAEKTGEWRAGVGRLLDGDIPAGIAPLIAPYLDAVRAANRDGPLAFYPGSPAIARHMLRRQDRLTAIELHPADAAALKENFSGDHQTRVIALDGWLALGAHLPPKERRGLVLVDPPYEKPGEFDRLVEGLKKAYRRWPGGIYALWYPIKHRAEADAFRAALARSGIADIVDLSLTVRKEGAEPALIGSGMAVVNPPFVLADEMAALHAFLQERLGEAGGGSAIATLSPERRPA